MRILVVEDDPTTSRSLELMLSHANINVFCTDLGSDAIDLMKLYDYDLVTLDLNLPDISGHEVLRQVRIAQINTPILILTGSDTVEDKIRAFGFGADDYLCKPFHREELIARIHALVRRSRGNSSPLLHVGDLQIDLDNQEARFKGQLIRLTGKEYRILELLALRQNTILTKEMFLNHLYGGMDEPELKIIDVFVCKLRRKLADVGMDPRHISTVWGRGYRLISDPNAL
jgi:two-component system cell cycle response regulator CtrA